MRALGFLTSLALGYLCMCQLQWVEGLESKVNVKQIQCLLCRLKDLASHLAFFPTHPFPVLVQRLT